MNFNFSLEMNNSLKMNKIIYIVLAITLIFTACNKPPDSYSTLPPWSGTKPISMIVNGVPFVADTANFFNNVPQVSGNALGSHVYGRNFTITYAPATKDTFTTERYISIFGPKDGASSGSTKKLNYGDLAEFIQYREVKKSLKAFNSGTIIYDRYYTTTNSHDANSYKVFTNTTLEYALNFYGTLRGIEDSSKFIAIENGYVSMIK